MDRKQKLSPDNLLKQFAPKHSDKIVIDPKITTSQISDALMKLTGKNGVLEGIKPIDDFKIIGKATTVKTSSNDWGTVIKGIYAAKKEDILVISCDDDNTAVWGELASTAANIQGIVGTVISGASRDSVGIKNLGYPVFSRNVVPNAGSPLAEGEINIPLICGDTTTYPGDLIIGDECGVVSVPDEISSEVLMESQTIVDKENKLTAQLNQSKSFMDLLRIK